MPNYSDMALSGPLDLLKIDEFLTRLKGLSSPSQAEKELTSALNIFRDIIFDMGDGVIAVDKNGYMLIWNKAAEDITGIKFTSLPLPERAHLIGNFRPDRITRYESEELPISRAIRGEAVDQEEIYILNDARPDGVWVSNTSRPICDSSGSIYGAVAVFRDITAQKEAAEKQRRLELKLAQTQKMEGLGMMAAGVAHDFNNLLMGVLGYVRLALNEVTPESNIHGRLEQIEHGAKRLADLTGQLLTYAGRTKTIETEVDLNGLIKESYDLLRTMIDEKAQIVASYGLNLPPILADPTAIRQIVMNLLINAIEAIGDKHGLIKIRTESKYCNAADLGEVMFGEELESGEHVYLEIADNGCGMSEETVARVFDPFFTTKKLGRGLGLAAVLGLVKRHDGAVRVISRPGEGTAFVIIFPAHEKARYRDISTPESGKTGKILVVDDEAMVLEVIQEMLELGGFRVSAYEDPSIAVSALQNNPEQFCAAVIDAKMPRLTGEVVYHQLREICPQLPIILISGFEFKEFGDSLPVDPMLTFLGKPFTPETLIAQLKRLLG